jgi:hypothetical protein
MKESINYCYHMLTSFYSFNPSEKSITVVVVVVVIVVAAVVAAAAVAVAVAAMSMMITVNITTTTVKNVYTVHCLTVTKVIQFSVHSQSKLLEQTREMKFWHVLI